MKITLIEPAMIKNKDFSEKPSWQLTPLTLATLAGLTPTGCRGGSRGRPHRRN
ncbi:MAG: hypothetical protein M3R47_09275 [Chloroflexota bacterium]|nr:hypothetical protein [Chloroflexota bacterium]